MSLPRRLSRPQWFLLIGGALVLLHLGTFLLAESLWFQGVNYGFVFQLRVILQGGLGLLFLGITLGIVGFNLRLAQRQRWHPLPGVQPDPLPGQMGFMGLFPLVISLGLGLEVLLLYHGRLAISHWYPDLTLYRQSTPLSLALHPSSLWELSQWLLTQFWVGVGVGVGLVVLLIIPGIMIRLLAGLISLSLVVVLVEQWPTILLAFHFTAFGSDEPLFGRNAGFYIFHLPLLELLEYWLVGVFSLTFVSVLLTYLVAGNSLSQGRFPGFSRGQHHHLWGLGGAMMLAIAFSYWISRYRLLYSTQGVSYGASYTDVTVQLPAYTFLSLGGLAIGLLLLGRAGFGGKRGADIQVSGSRKTGEWGEELRQEQRFRAIPRGKQRTIHPPTVSKPYITVPKSDSRLPTKPMLYLVGGYVLATVMAELVLPLAVQRLVVQPNELQRETPFIQRTIAFTRQAFDLDDIEVETFDPQGNLTYADLQDNELTVRNIRLWDTRPLLETNRQLQRIRPYYEFPNADIDRYTLSTETGGTTQQQVLIAARELNYDDVPAEAQTWVNKHLIYTHGYGFTLSPVNMTAEGGLPDYFVSGIEQNPSSDIIRNSIPLANPRIYYGELTNTYVMTNTRARELDYPSGSENVYNTYDGIGGVSIGNSWQRLLFAKHLGDWRMLLTEDFTPQTRLLFRREIKKRVRAIAPFLRYDDNPYLVVANPEGSFAATAGTPSTLYWIMDAYTVSDRYPYSDPLGNPFNYVRNSVKVVIDAYNGSIQFFIADDRDPIINAWNEIFPGMFRPINTMPPTLLSHIRYPQNLFEVQSNQLMTYHMTDPQVFYNREDQWRAPNEVYGDEAQLVEPYYLIMKLPAEASEEFILLRPFTPNQRTNLIAWLAARSDRIYTPGRRTQASKMLLYRFPKQELVYGPEQIEARINQDPLISQQISLWNRRGSSAVQGNLLIIPIEQSLLYVEPLYLEATLNRLPTLAKVITSFQNRIVMADTLEQSLRVLFQPDAEETPAILRTLEDELPIPE